MSDRIPRLRMFAGPNGSGKTTVKTNLNKSPQWFGAYVNADDMESMIRHAGGIDLQQYHLTATTQQVRDFFTHSPLFHKAGLGESVNDIHVSEHWLCFPPDRFNSYHASILSDFFRKLYLNAKQSFTFETVMSHPDKVELLKQARQLGYRTYLYFIGTEDVETNIQRVRNRVHDGGHDVPPAKIRERYDRSLSLLPQAIGHSSRAFLFDNSSDKPVYFAEITEARTMEFHTGELPRWFEPTYHALVKDPTSGP